MSAERKCGNCHHWGVAADQTPDGERPCNWPAPDLPFWANLGDDWVFAGWTKVDHGRTCRTFEPKEGECTCQCPPGKVEGFAAVALDCPIHGDDDGELEE